MSSTWGCLVRSLIEAIADVAAAGQPFEVIEVEHDGVTNRAFKNTPATLRQFFDSARGLEETFLVYEDEEWTFAEVMREVDALGDALVHHYGIKKGDRVGIAMRNYPEWVVAFGAIVSVGAISVSLNAWWTEAELDFAVDLGERETGVLERADGLAEGLALAHVVERPAERGFGGGERRGGDREALLGEV